MCVLHNVKKYAYSGIFESGTFPSIDDSRE